MWRGGVVWCGGLWCGGVVLICFSDAIVSNVCLRLFLKDWRLLLLMYSSASEPCAMPPM